MTTLPSVSDQPTAVIDIPVPPPALRYHVFSREVSSEEFLEAGRLCAASLERALSLGGRTTASFSRVLDFGCGSARVLRHFASLFATTEFHGTDVADSVIAWNRTSVVGATFHLNAADPPLPFEDDFFDYVWSVSVFSHLPETMALAWLDELRRVLRPGGLALVTVHGRFRFEEACRPGGCMTREGAAEFETKGFTYVRAFKDGILPEWYQNAFMCESYVRRVLARKFDVLSYIPRGMIGRQDIVLIQRPHLGDSAAESV